MKLPIPDTPHSVYGKFREVPGAPVVVLIHGLASSMDGVPYFLFARTLEQAGYSSFRISLYSDREGGRKMVNSTLATHAHDLSVALDFLHNQDSGRPIVLLGHSFGALTIIEHGPQHVDAVAFWDPSPEKWTTGELPRDREWIEQVDAFRVSWGIDILFGKQMFNHLQTVKPFELMKTFRCPLFVAVAGDGVLIESSKQYFDLAQGQKHFEIIEGADHNFLEDDSVFRLFDATLTWLKATVPARSENS